jgi:hypothetical protein
MASQSQKSPSGDLIIIVKGGTIGLTQYDIVGLTEFTDFFAPSQVVQTFVEGLPQQNGKPAFVFNTFGFIGGTSRFWRNGLTRRAFESSPAIPCTLPKAIRR